LKSLLEYGEKSTEYQGQQLFGRMPRVLDDRNGDPRNQADERDDVGVTAVAPKDGISRSHGDLLSAVPAGESMVREQARFP
jgi:hypothetical protein